MSMLQLSWSMLRRTGCDFAPGSTILEVICPTYLGRSGVCCASLREGRGRWFSLLMLAFVAGCQFAGIQITLRLIQWSADFYNALQRVDAPAALTQITVFAGLIGISAALHLMSTFVRQHIQIKMETSPDRRGAGSMVAAQGLLVSAAGFQSSAH